MSTLVYPIAQLMERLKGAESIAFVGSTRDLETAAVQGPRVSPSVFVLNETTGGKVHFSGPPLQQPRETVVNLVVWVVHHGDPVPARSALDAAIAAIDARLAGWTPGDAFGGLTFEASRDEQPPVPGQFLLAQAIYRSSWDFIANTQP